MIVLDCSAIIEILRNTEDGKSFQALMHKDEKVITCDLALVEVSSVLRKLVRKGEIDRQEAVIYYQNAVSLPDKIVPLADLQPEALHESIRLDHSVYNVSYFVLARRTAGTLFTLDMKLVDLCLHNGVSYACPLD